MPWRILAIDDNQTFLSIIDTGLKSLDHEIETASSGAEGIRKVKAFNPDLIILDIMMPEMDGWETLDHIRKFTNAPVIMLSASNPDGKLKRTSWLKADAYLFKPIPFTKLRARIEALLQRDLEGD